MAKQAVQHCCPECRPQTPRNLGFRLVDAWPSADTFAFSRFVRAEDESAAVLRQVLLQQSPYRGLESHYLNCRTASAAPGCPPLL